MSGPKGYAYRVEAERLRRRREQAARRARCAARLATWDHLAAELERYGPQAAQPRPVRGAEQDWAAWEQTLRDAVARARQALRLESLNLVQQRLAAARPAPRPAPARARLEAELAKVAGAVAQVRDGPARERLADLAAKVGAVEAPRQAQADLLTLKTRLAEALRAQGWQDLAQQACEQIAHLGGEAAEAVRAQAELARSAEQVAQVRAAAEALALAWAGREAADYAVEALREALAELGFTWAGGFEAVGPDSVAAVAGHPDHPGYGLRLQVNAATARFFTRLVAEGPSSPAADAAAEAAACAKVKALPGALRRWGVAASLDFEREAGQVPLLRLAPPAGRRAQSGGQRQARRQAGRQTRRQAGRRAQAEREDAGGSAS
ncbi:MAG: hypothetical protein LBD51_05005 [Bifidobacteriaceae bacterium]|jgi:hypothetical protein|nr:hypothetical protein [Bifidobacteriaceae bacterium]